ncbi:cytochrome P450 [Athelia psychrophila]|uniref:Cytochrome P450 n=1 Tax=Athelia psychrophila TaxID=1759441 RepID=A0A166AKH4_9AGAM|nr:cytochrome P450 [Fibularhizoctonia sp. CBS 109695]
MSLASCITNAPQTSVLLLCATSLTLIALWFRRPKSYLPLPPGPRPIYALGNLRDFTSKELWVRSRQWAKDYGSIVYLHIFGQGIVFLNTPEAVSELLDKRGDIYSDRPQFVSVAFIRYGDQSKRQRKYMQKALGASSIREYQPLITTETASFLNRLLDDPTDYVNVLRRYAGGLTLFVIYGHEVKSSNDVFLAMADNCVRLFSNRIANPGTLWAVDIVPALRFLPSWLPGMSFKRDAKVWKAMMQEFVDAPFEFAQDLVGKGISMPSFCRTLLADGREGLTEQEVFDIKWTANSMYAASTRHTRALVENFIHAMVTHPDVRARAQAEIDAVVGADRLPSFADRASLPYIECVMSECLRWAAPVPLGLPHRLMEDDVYNGMFIPKGTLVVGNNWAIMRDSTMYPNPDVFYPERFMTEIPGSNGARRRDPRQYVFGFGRRRCPGAHLIESSAWLLMVSMLATLDMGKAVDANGSAIEPRVTFDDAVFRIPSSFEFSLKPRSARAAELIRQSN